MPRAKRKSTKAVAYRCVKAISYPASDSVRRRIQGGERVPAEEREPWAQHAVGETLRESDLPPEVFAACIRRGLIEPKEASDDAQK